MRWRYGVSTRAGRWIGMASLASGMLFAGCGGKTQTAQQKAEVVSGLHMQKVQLRNVADELEAPGSVIAVSTSKHPGGRSGVPHRPSAHTVSELHRGNSSTPPSLGRGAVHRTARGRVPGRRSSHGVSTLVDRVRERRQQ